MSRIHTIDAHVGGAALRLILDGAPLSAGGTIAERLEEMRTQHDGIRRVLMHEPRGHGAMAGALLTAPESRASDAGVLFMHAGGWSALCGHGLIAVSTIALDRGLVARPEGRSELRLDTAAGPVVARFRTSPVGDAARVAAVAWSGVPAWLVRPGLSVRLPRRALRVDVAHAGETYAIVDSEACGLPLDGGHVPEMVRVGREIALAVESVLGPSLPAGPDGPGVAGTVFTGPPAGGGGLRAATVYPDGAVDRSPGGLATCAVMAVLHSMGLLAEEGDFVLESLIGTTLSGRVVGRTLRDETPVIIPEIEGRAFITGEHTFVIDEEDPLRDGFVLELG